MISGFGFLESLLPSDEIPAIAITVIHFIVGFSISVAGSISILGIIGGYRSFVLPELGKGADNHCFGDKLPECSFWNSDWCLFDLGFGTG
ncbi:MAG: hypothetical protein MZV63_14635 [Marinilabiliales bacterium]|nr:hypothetical protein [Marinilabiliales bacterium]